MKEKFHEIMNRNDAQRVIELEEYFKSISQKQTLVQKVKKAGKSTVSVTFYNGATSKKQKQSPSHQNQNGLRLKKQASGSLYSGNLPS